MDVRALIFVLGSSGSQLLTRTIIAASSVADTPILAVKFLITHQLRETGQYHRAGVRGIFDTVCGWWNFRFLCKASQRHILEGVKG